MVLVLVVVVVVASVVLVEVVVVELDVVVGTAATPARRAFVNQSRAI